MRSSWLWIAVAVCVVVPSIILRVTHVELPSAFAALVFGIAIFAAAFLIAWAAEAVQKDLGHGLIIALIAFIAVLPEYAVDMTFSWKAGQDFTTFGEFPLANMTGANRLLIGLGWPLVLAIIFLRKRVTAVKLEQGHAAELVILALASLYMIWVFTRGTLTLLDGVVLTLFFIAYFRLISRMKISHETEVVGPAKTIAAMPRKTRLFVAFGMFLYAAGAILASAEPFAESLVASGKILGIDEFVLVQWIAPLASEAPEILIAVLFAWHLRPTEGLAALISSNVNQWTLLVASIPLVFGISAESFAGFPFSDRQGAEVLLTAAQALFAVVLLARLRLSWVSAVVLLVLFIGQLLFPSTQMRMLFGIGYILLSGLVIIVDTGRIQALVSSFKNVLRETISKNTTK